MTKEEQEVPFEWNPDDVILDLYEVKTVTEGFGSQMREKKYHEGGFGRVYKVWHRTWLRNVAVKCPREHVFTTHEQIDAFSKECEIWINLGLHPHVASCHYVRTLGGVPRVFSEYAEAGTLEEWIRSGRLYEGGMDVALSRILDASIQFAWGLHYAHECGVIHQDVKPLNALMWNDGILKISDFGIAGARQKAGLPTKLEDFSNHSIMVSSGAMTPAYCSPEQLAGKKLDRRTDIWSWAVSVLEMFTGGVVWQSGIAAPRIIEQISNITNNDGNIPQMPEGVASLLKWCFQRDASTRPQTLQECSKVLCKVFSSVDDRNIPRVEPPRLVDSPDTLNNRALSFIDLGKQDDALIIFDKAISLDNLHVGAAYNRGILLWRMAKITDSEIDNCLQGIAQNGQNISNAEYALGCLHIENGNFTSAILNFQHAIDLGAGHLAERELLFAKSFTSDLQYLPTPPTQSAQIASIRSAVYSSSGRLAIFCDWHQVDVPWWEYTVWDISTGRHVLNFEGSDFPYHVAISPDEKLAVASYFEPSLRIWDLSTGRMVGVLEGHTSTIASIAYSNNGMFVLSTGRGEKTARMWDVSRRECMHIFEGHGSTVTSVAFSPDDRMALTAEVQDNVFRMWSVSTGECLRFFRGHQNRITCVAFSPCGNYVLSGGFDKTLRLWDVNSGECLRVFYSYEQGCDSVDFSPDGQLALSSHYSYSDGKSTFRLWNLSTGRCLGSKSDCSVKNARFRPEGDSVIMKQSFDWIYSWGEIASDYNVYSNNPSGEGEDELPMPEFCTSTIWNLRLLSEQKLLAPWIYAEPETADDLGKRRNVHYNLLQTADHAFKSQRVNEALTYIKQAREIRGFERSPESLSLQGLVGRLSRIGSFSGVWQKLILKKRVLSASFVPNTYVALLAGPTLEIWDFEPHKHLRTLEGHEGPVFSVTVSGDGRYALSGGKDKTVRLWDLCEGTCLRVMDGHTDSVGLVGFTFDGQAVSFSRDSYIRKHDLVTGECIQSFQAFPPNVVSTFSPDGRMALVGGWTYPEYILWDIDTGKELSRIDTKYDGSFAAQFAPDSKHVILHGNSGDGSLRLLEVPTLNCVHEWEHRNFIVNTIAYPPDNRYLLTGADGGALQLWDTVNGCCVRELAGYTEDVAFVTFSSEGRFALSGDVFGPVRLWEFDWEYECDPAS